MSYLTVSNAIKQFNENFRGLDQVSLSVEKGEFFTLLGPSGCGKTTLLRSIAGFNDLTSGDITLNGSDLRRIPPHQRDIGMVFQDYAVFPHLSVFDNVAFGLKPRKIAKDEIRRLVNDALAAVRLTALADRMPAAMSGGQQQRIGIARAMVIKPRLLLMDEPLSNLDAKLRIELREEIRDIQKQIDIAAIYVTHDQEEALAISDRICVMNGGRVEQIGTPQAIYGDPQTLLVANFVGTLNKLQAGPALDKIVGQLQLPKAASWTVRPEGLHVHNASADARPHVLLGGTVSKYTYLGREAHVHIESELGDLIVQQSNPGMRAGLATGQAVQIMLLREALMGFDGDGQRVTEGG